MIYAEGPELHLHGNTLDLLGEFTCITKNLRDSLAECGVSLGAANEIITEAFTHALQFHYMEGVISDDNSGI